MAKDDIEYKVYQTPKELLEFIDKKSTLLTPYKNVNKEEVPIMDVIKRKAEDLKNIDLAQNIKLKKYTLFILLIFLGIETIVIFSYAYFQGIHFKGFQLEEWSFKLLVTATIIQITYMLQVAVKHLFPNK